jgi:type VI protein secretion system component VasK
MKGALMFLATQVRYGFYGLHGFLGVLLGLFLCAVVIWGIWQIFNIVSTKFGKPETAWMFQIARVILIVFTVVFFVNAIFGLGWW